MFKNILLAYDGSEHSHRAARMAGAFAHQQTAFIWIVCVADRIPPELGEPNFSQLIEKRKSQAQEKIDEARRLIGDHVQTQQEILFGDTAESVINVAETRQCDLIVIGSRGLGTLSALLLGSQTQKVIHLAKCAVLVVK